MFNCVNVVLLAGLDLSLLVYFWALEIPFEIYVATLLFFPQ